MAEIKNDHPMQEDDQKFYENKIQKRYVDNVLKVSQVTVTRVLLKAPSHLYPPDFENELGIWEQYWDQNGKKLFERRISAKDLN
ncbi:hypothetical protein [Secundilactobacillus muriivasis]